MIDGKKMSNFFLKKWVIFLKKNGAILFLKWRLKIRWVKSEISHIYTYYKTKTVSANIFYF